jgi:ribosomal protein S18 acetylase RimI-like enzyme
MTLGQAVLVRRTGVELREATPADIPALLALEERCFAIDRLSRRSFHHLLSHGNAVCQVVERDGDILGYVLLLFRLGLPLARMYSLAVDPDAQGQGLGRMLLEAGEAAARERNCVSMRLEAHPDNAAAIRLYRAAGYREFGVYPDYYEDHADAKRFEKRMITGPGPDRTRVPYYAQTLEFTCGAAALMMAMGALDGNLRLDRRLELRLWRESTTVYMTEGHGGSGPHGLALAAYRRGFNVRVHVSDETDLFINSVRSAHKKEVIKLVEEDFLAEIAETDMVVERGRLGVDDLAAAFAAGEVPVVMISSYRIDRSKTPHWVTLAGIDDQFVYVHDPYVDLEEQQSPTDCMSMPIPRAEFARMVRYGRAQLQASIVLGPGRR